MRPWCDWKWRRHRSFHNKIETSLVFAIFFQPLGMQTVFDKVLSDFLVISLLQNIASLTFVATSQIFENIDVFIAKLMCLIVYFFICAVLIHLSTFCFTRLACIYLIGTIEYINGERVIYFGFQQKLYFDFRKPFTSNNIH